jgi:parvulin-like peptidyl-prolyl isomerase
MIKKITYFLIITLFSFLSLAESGTQILAVVGDDVITYNDVQTRYKVIVATNNLQVNNEQEAQMLSRQVLQSLINEKIFLQESKKLKIKVSEDEISNIIIEIEKQNNIPKGHFEDFLKSKNISKADAIAQITNSITWEKIMDQIISPQVQVSLTELNEYIENQYPQNFQVEFDLYTAPNDKQSGLKNVYDKVKACNISDKLKLPEEVKYAHVKNKVKDLPQNLKNKIQGINIGQKTEIFSEKQVAEFFILCEKKPSLTEEEISKIKASLLDKKMSLQADYYMKNLSKKTFVEIYDK